MNAGVNGLRLLLATSFKRLETAAPLLQASGWLLSGYAGQIPLGLLQSILLARLLGLTSYGVYVAILTVITTLAQLIVCNVTQFVIREYTNALDAGDASRASAAVKFSYGVEAVSAIVVFSGVWLTSGLLGSYLASGLADQSLVRIAAVILLVDLCTMTSQSILLARKKFRSVSFAYVLQSLVPAAVALVCFVIDLASLPVLLAGVVCGYGCRALFLHLCARRELHLTLGKSWASVAITGGTWPLRQWFAYVAQTNLGDSLTVLTKSGSLWLAFLAPPQPIALYKIADSIGGFVFLGLRALGDASYPDLVRLVDRADPAVLKRYLVRTSVLGGIGIAAVCAVLAALSPVLIGILYGDAYAGALPALLILLFGGGLCGAVYWAPGLILAKGRPGVSALIKLLIALVQVPLMLVLIPVLQHVGAAISVSVGRVALVAWLATAGIKLKNAA